MSACKLLLLGLLAVCSASALSKDLVTDVDTHRTKVGDNNVEHHVDALLLVSLLPVKIGTGSDI